MIVDRLYFLYMQEEIFKDIPNYEGIYQISNLGRVKSLGNNLKRKKKILKMGIGNGYYKVNLYKNGIQNTFIVHKLVAIAFLNHKPDGTLKIVVDHINNVKTDNRVENLQLISNRENSSKDRKYGSSQYIGVCWNKKLNKWQSQININGKQINLGLFTSEFDASKAYQNKLAELNNSLI